MADGYLVASRKLDPPLKWAGGKRWFASRFAVPLRALASKTLVEPFVGSGAVFFGMMPRAAVLADANEELIQFYSTLRDFPMEVRRALMRHAKRHCKAYYYEVRAREEAGAIKQAARMLYLNRTCWNALYRVNRSGRFNVPIGTKDAVLLASDNFAGWSSLLSRAKFRCDDFEEVIDATRRGQFLFADPPYFAPSRPATFAKYNANVFSWADQVRLSDAVKRAHKRGVKFMLTNADTIELQELYASVGKLHSIHCSSVISGANKGRGTRRELLWTNIPSVVGD